MEKKQIIFGVCKVGSWKVKIGSKKHPNFWKGEVQSQTRLWTSTHTLILARLVLELLARVYCKIVFWTTKDYFLPGSGL